MAYPSPAPLLTKCSQSKCNQLLPHDSKFKTCDKCRTQNCINSQKKRQQQKEGAALKKRQKDGPEGNPVVITIGEMDSDDGEAVSQIPMSYKHFSSNKF